MNLWSKMYHFERSYFTSMFKVNAPNYLELINTDGECFIGEEFNVFRIDDEVYIVELETGIIVNYYKHLGRTNRVNCELSKKEFERFLKELNGDLWEYCELY